ncbi:MAG: RNA polymerase sigma factor [bacterium]
MTQSVTEFAAIYRKYAPELFRFAMYLCGERADAEDITSETFVRAWTSSAPIAAETVKAYLFTIARNLYLHRARTRTRHVTLDDSLVDPRADPHERTAQRAELNEVNERLARLSEVDRAVVQMRMDGAPYEEIAAVLGVSVSAARVKLHRARLALAGIR